jgi:hypothetical protein
MIVKAAYFSFVGLAETDMITWEAHLRPAINRGRGLMISWPNAGAGHNVRAWAELLVAARASTTATAYSASFDLDIQKHGQRIEQLWSETLRYHKNYAYLHEVRRVREAAEWFLINSHAL